jgi:hypothetical protein
MRQICFAFVPALILATAMVMPAAANSHVAVTAPPQTGVGTMAVSSLGSAAALLVAAAALLFLSIRQWRRA